MFILEQFNYITIKQKMGQCMEQVLVSTKVHPFLGHLQEVKQGSSKLLKLYLPISNEEDYIEWCKRINKLRYNFEIKEHFYTPIREQFKRGNGLCQATAYLQLLLDPYQETLKQLLVKNKKNRRYFSQPFLWILLHTLLKCFRYFQRKEEKTQTYRFDNILVWPNGKVKIVPDIIIPIHQINPTFQIQFDDSNDSTQATYFHPKKQVSNLQIFGVICLTLADLLEPPPQSSNLWIGLSEQIKNESLKNCEKRYSKQLMEIISELLNNSKSINMEQLYQKINAMEAVIPHRFQSQMISSLNVSKANMTKSSHCLENKTVNYQTIMAVSNYKNETDKCSTEELMNDKHEIQSLDEPYFTIL